MPLQVGDVGDQADRPALARGELADPRPAAADAGLVARPLAAAEVVEPQGDALLVGQPRVRVGRSGRPARPGGRSPRRWCRGPSGGPAPGTWSRNRRLQMTRRSSASNMTQAGVEALDRRRRAGPGRGPARPGRGGARSRPRPCRGSALTRPSPSRRKASLRLRSQRHEPSACRIRYSTSWTSPSGAVRRAWRVASTPRHVVGVDQPRDHAVAHRGDLLGAVAQHGR